MEFWIFVVPVAIAIVFYLVKSNKKNTEYKPIHKINLNQINSSASETETKVKSKKNKLTQAVLAVSEKEENKAEQNPSPLAKFKDNLGLKVKKKDKGKDKENEPVKTQETDEGLKLESVKPNENQSDEVQNQSDVETNLAQRGPKVNEKKSNQPLSSLKKWVSKTIDTFTPKFDEKPTSNQQSQNTETPSVDEQFDVSEIYIYLQSKEDGIDSKKFLHHLTNLGFQLVHETGYYHRALLVQDENGGVIHRMNIDSEVRNTIRVYFDPSKIKNDLEFSEAIGIISTLAKELECDILNLKREPITENDLDLMHQAFLYFNQ